jgi:hypothetical protein
MLDDLRNQANTPLFEEEPNEPKYDSRRTRSGGGYFLGMSPGQRFAMALLLFLMVCVLGSFCLVITERVWLPFL